MKLVDNYKDNDALSAVVDLNRAKGIIGAVESTRLDMEESQQKLRHYTTQLEEAIAKHGENFSTWPDNLRRIAENYAEQISVAYIATAGYYYSSKLCEKMISLKDSVLRGLPKNDARKRFHEYDESLKEDLAWDYAVLMYLSSLGDQQSFEHQPDYFDTNAAVGSAEKILQGKNYKYLRPYVTDIDFEEIISKYTVTPSTLGDVLVSLQPTIATHI